MVTDVVRQFNPKAPFVSLWIALAIWLSGSAVLADEQSEIEAWADSYFATALSNSRTVGGAIVVAGPNGPIFSKGYGYGNYGPREPIHPVVSYVPIADIGTAFMSEILLDLASVQQLSLDRPVNEFLTRLQLPGAYAKITVRDLLGARSALPSSPSGSLVNRDFSGSVLNRFNDLFQKEDKNTDPPLRHPGPYASGLGALMIEDLTGRTIQSHLAFVLEEELDLTPYYNSPNSSLPEFIVHHHTISKYGEIENQPFYAAPSVFLPSNGIYLTLGDVATLSSHLLKTLKLEQSATAEPDEGEAEKSKFELRNDLRNTAVQPFPTYGISGQVQSVSTDLILLPESDLAVFVMLTGASKAPDLSWSNGRKKIQPPLLARDVTKQFVLHHMRSGSVTPFEMSENVLARFSGTFVLDTARLSRPEDIFVFARSITNVAADADGNLLIGGLGPYTPVAKNHFVNRQTGATATFYLTDSGTVVGLDGISGTMTRLHESPSVTLTMAAALLACLFSVQLIRAIAWPCKSRKETIASWTGAFAGLAVIGALLTPVYAYSQGWPSPYVNTSLFLNWSYLLWSIAGFSIFIAVFSVWSWIGHFWALEGHGFLRRRQYTFGSLGLLGLAYILSQFGLLNLP